MRIGFDARMITHPGIGNYIRFLLSEMIPIDSGNEFYLFGEPSVLEEAFGKNDNIKIIKWNVPIYSVAEQINLPYENIRLDLVHIPHFNIPVRSSKKIVATIHDLIYINFPASLIFFPAKQYASFMMKKVLNKCPKIISVSEHTKKDITETFGDKYEDRIRTIYEAPAITFNKISEEKDLFEIREKYGLRKNIVLYVGSIKPHKNIGVLIKACKNLALMGIECQLALAGRWDKKEDHLKREIDGEYVKYLGEVSGEELRELYSIADVFAQISLYEGFGLTILEAMRCDLPVVIADSSSLTEVAGDAALVVTPHNIGQITDTIYNVLVNKRLRVNMVAAGRKRVETFSWEKAAKETLEVYRQALNKS